MQKTHSSVAALPDVPGVYMFIDAGRAVLYVGKATSIRDRVRSYFGVDLHETRGPALVTMVEKAARVDYVATDTVLEALILEAKLIKELKPTYNIRDKDDKSYHYVLITDEPWPRLLLVRGHELAQGLHEYPVQAEYGPFPHAGQLKEALKLIRKIFPYYDTKHPVATLMAKGDKKLIFNQTIGIYPDVTVSEEEYALRMKHVRQFFDGKKKQVIRELEREMKRYAKTQEFEKAGRAKRQLFGLQHLNDVSLLKRNNGDVPLGRSRVEAYDIAHHGGTHMVGVMVVVENGEPQKSAYRKFTIKTVHSTNDTAALREVLSRRFGHTEWGMPALIAVDGSTAQMNAAKKILDEFGYKIPIVGVVKDEHHRPRTLKGIRGHEKLRDSILLANAEAHRFAISFHRKKSQKLTYYIL